jgi:hypothetical protein
MADAPQPLRLADILTTAAAVANYVAAPTLTATHVLLSIDILAGQKAMEDLGRPQSPLVATRRGPAPVEPAVQHLAQRWFEALGSDVHAEFNDETLAAFIADLRQIEPR